MPTIASKEFAQQSSNSVRPTQHARDLAAGTGSVELPLALERKYPRAPYEIGWQLGVPGDPALH